MAVPEVLLSGDHARIQQWRRQQAAQRRVSQTKEVKQT
jgi:tRNA (guanine-N1)-methyltransferase